MSLTAWYGVVEVLKPQPRDPQDKTTNIRTFRHSDALYRVLYSTLNVLKECFDKVAKASML